MASGGRRTDMRTHMVHPRRRRTRGGKGKEVGEGGVARRADEVTDWSRVRELKVSRPPRGVRRGKMRLGLGIWEGATWWRLYTR